MSVKVTLNYGDSRKTEVWVEGSHMAVGCALDALLGHHENASQIKSIKITPNSKMPVFEQIQDAKATRNDDLRQPSLAPDTRSLPDKLADEVKGGGGT